MRSGSSSTCRHDKVVAMELLDEYWFFQNLLNRTRILRSSLHLCCSENNMGRSPENTFSSADKLPKGDVNVSSNMFRTPKLTPCVGKEKADREEESRRSLKKPQRLISTSSDILLASSRGAQLHFLQSVAPNSRIPRYRLPRKDSTVAGANKEGTNKACSVMKEASYKRLNYKRWKSQSDLEFEEVRGFMDLGFIFNKEELDPSLMNMIPGLQNNRHNEEDNVRRPYLSEAWIAGSSAPLLLNWVDRNSVVGMKEQIKFWARAVASDVRQECF